MARNLLSPAFMLLPTDPPLPAVVTNSTEWALIRAMAERFALSFAWGCAGSCWLVKQRCALRSLRL